jgi:hypothetical protein
MKLKQYASLCAAGILGGGLQGQINYSDLDPDLDFNLSPPDFSVEIDVDGDGINDLQFNRSNRSYGFGFSARGLSGAQVGAFETTSFISSCTDWLVRQAPYGALLNAGVVDWRSDAEILINTFPCGDLTNWDEDDLGYMGFRLPNGAGFNYGWLRIERLPDGPPPARSRMFVFYDYALNATVDDPIRAGDPGANCITPQNAQSEVSGSSVDLSWIKVPGASNYTLEATETGSGTMYTRTRATNAFSIPVVPTGTYAWKVRANCGALGSSGFTDEDTFSIPMLRMETLDLSELRVFPNPSSGAVQVQFGDQQDDYLRLFSLSGQLLDEWLVSGMPNISLNLDLAPGSYLLEASSPEGKRRSLLVLE